MQHKAKKCKIFRLMYLVCKVCISLVYSTHYVYTMNCTIHYESSHQTFYMPKHNKLQSWHEKTAVFLKRCGGHVFWCRASLQRV